MQGLYSTVCVHWSGPWYSTCVHTAVGRTQSGIEQEYWHPWSHMLIGLFIRTKYILTETFPAEAYSCLQVCFYSESNIILILALMSIPTELGMLQCSTLQLTSGLDNLLHLQYFYPNKVNWCEKLKCLTRCFWSLWPGRSKNCKL